MIQYIFGLPVYIGSFENPQCVIDEVEYCRNNVKPKRQTQIVDELGGVQDEDEGILFDLRAYINETKYINSEIVKHTKQFLKELNIEKLNLTTKICRDEKCTSLDCTDIWFNIYNKGDHTSEHCHLGDSDDEIFCGPSESMFSFNYMAKYNPKTDAGFYFSNPSPIHVFYSEIQENVPQLKKSIKLNIKEGQIVIFPSCFYHFVERHTVDNQRMTLSGNLKKSSNTYIDTLIKEKC